MGWWCDGGGGREGGGGEIGSRSVRVVKVHSELRIAFRLSL